MADASIPESSEPAGVVQVSEATLHRLFDALAAATQRAEHAEAEVARLREELARRPRAAEAERANGHRRLPRFQRVV